MNYRHIYHAGNFADILKHIALIEVIEYYKRKDTPFFVLDAFAGIGEYDISDERALKTEEMKNGVLKLLDKQLDLPYEFSKYVSIVSKYIKNNIYPGSPIIIRDLLREQDRAIYSELHHEDYLTLKNVMYPSPVHNIDAYNAVKAFTPPYEKRGIIFLDPPFEEKNEFSKLTQAISNLYKRFRNGTIIIWYPIKNSAEVQKFYSHAKASNSCEQIIVEMELSASEKLFKTGLLVINPTWGLKDLLQSVSRKLKEILS